VVEIIAQLDVSGSVVGLNARSGFPSISSLREAAINCSTNSSVDILSETVIASKPPFFLTLLNAFAES
jgi:hypothetical protein